MSLLKRSINLQFQLGEGDFGEAGLDTFSVEGLRVSASIVQAGGVSLSELDLRVFGLPFDVMNKLSILNKGILQYRRNIVIVYASGAVAFQGIIQEAWIDGNASPDLSFALKAIQGLDAAIKPVPVQSFRGSAEASIIASGIAKQMGLTLENSGVRVMLSNPYFHGTLLDQLQELSRAANFEYFIDGTTLAIWPRGSYRQGVIPLIAPDTGLIGYPLLAQNGVEVKTLYNPGIALGGRFTLESSIRRVNGDWTVNNIAHNLESETPNGAWFTTIGGRIDDFQAAT